MSIIVCRDGIIASYSNARPPFIFFNGSDFHGKITVFMIKTDIILIAVLQSFCKVQVYPNSIHEKGVMLK